MSASCACSDITSGLGQPGAKITFYPMAIFYAEFLGDADPFPVLESTAARIGELTRSLTDSQLAAAPAPGKWSIHQIVAHLADAELVGQSRIRYMLFEDNPPLPGWNQDRWMTVWNREGETWTQTLERFRVLRESTLRPLSRHSGDRPLPHRSALRTWPTESLGPTDPPRRARHQPPSPDRSSRPTASIRILKFPDRFSSALRLL